MRRSAICKLPREEFIELIASSSRTGEALSFFGLKNKGGNHRTLKERMVAEGLEHEVERYEKAGRNYRIKCLDARRQHSLDTILVEASTYSGSSQKLKRRIVKEGLLRDVCAVCGLKPSWQGKKLTLTLDHINGAHDDNRIENLRVLCSNCHSQTATFSGKKTRSS